MEGFYKFVWNITFKNFFSSEGSDLAFNHVIELVRHEIDELILITIRKKHLIESKETQLDQKTSADTLLKKYFDRAKEKHIKHVQLINEEAEDVREELVSQAKFLAADYLVVGSRGLSKISKMLLGSVSDFCARHAPCAVIIVREKVL